MKLFITVFVSIMSLVVFDLSASEYQTAKCYVEMTGGGETVHTISYPDGGMKISDVKKSIAGHEIYFNSKKVEIYRVKECVFEPKAFKSNIAREIDKNRDPI